MIKELELNQKWQQVLAVFRSVTGRTPDMNGILFLIGIQELGQGIKTFTKEEKQDLMHIAICRLLSKGGYYSLIGQDENGWPHWKLIKPLPSFDLLEQEMLLKMQVIDYLNDEGLM